MQLLKGDVDGFRLMTLYVRDGFSAYRQRSYVCGRCEVIVFAVAGMIFMHSACTGILIYKI